MHSIDENHNCKLDADDFGSTNQAAMQTGYNVAQAVLGGGGGGGG